MVASSRLGTPRRLAVHVADLVDRQPDLSEQVLGPARSVAYDASGALTKAGEAFARKLGVEPGALVVVDTPKGPYVAATREEQGRAASEVLPDVLRRLCAQIPFQKSMRWAEGDTPFGRPVQWLVALLGEQVVPLDFARVVSGRATLGHRFLAPGPVDVPHADRCSTRCARRTCSPTPTSAAPACTRRCSRRPAASAES